MYFQVMKYFFFICLFVGSTVSQVGAQGGVSAKATSRTINLLPEQKTSLVMRLDERNPFARRSPEKEEVAVAPDEDSEEARIRKIFESLPVTGVSRGSRGLRALVGDMILEQGYIVPQMLKDQTEFLVVDLVEENQITLAWINLDTNDRSGKTLSLGFDLEAKVRSALAGRSLSEDEKQAFFERKIDRERRREALANASVSEGDDDGTEIRPMPRAKPMSAPNGLESDIYLKGQ